MRSQFYVWERGVYKGDTVSADSIYRAVQLFAGTDVTCLQSTAYMMCGTDKSNPAKFITVDGSAREFTAYKIGDVPAL